MITKVANHLYQYECTLFLSINSQFDRQRLKIFFSLITHMGGAVLTIGITLLLILISTNMPIQKWGIESALALASSHILVTLIKKIYPRNRPYRSLSQARVVVNPLMDHSFPSGHTTAIFSVITPYILHMPILGFILYPIACCVGVSRVFLGLHYPSDVLFGAIVGSVFGMLVFYLF